MKPILVNGITLIYRDKKILFTGLYASTFNIAWDLSSKLDKCITHHLYHLALFFSDLRLNGAIKTDIQSHYDIICLSDSPSIKSWSSLLSIPFIKIPFV